MDPSLKDVLFLAGRCLPDEDKIKLIDIVPGIENYVKSFDTSTKRDQVGMRVGALLKRLPHLRKVVTKTPRHHCQVLMNLAEFNTRITIFEGFYGDAEFAYMERVKEQNPNYDARHVENVFDYDFGQRVIECYLEKYPDLALKLAVVMESPEDEV